MTNAQKTLYDLAKAQGPRAHIEVTRESTLRVLERNGYVDSTHTGGNYYFIRILK